MNKIENAIEAINNISKYCKILKSPEEFFKHMQGHRTELSMVLSAFDTANLSSTIIEILEKQMSKKIDIFDFGKAHCPICKTDIHGIGKIKFCIKCGQNLEW